MIIRWLDISRIVRNKKRFLTKETPIQINTRRITNSDRVLDVLRDSNKLLSFTEIGDKANIRSTGNLHNILRLLMKDKVIHKINGLYKLI